jgi:type IV pilus assembly protein PilW
MIRCRGHRPARPLIKSLAGFTLIELMVSMVLGLIVIAGVTSVFLANQQAYRTNQALGDVQDGSRIAFELMAHDIRNAGLTGCDNNGRVSNVLNNSPAGGGNDWWANWGNALVGYGGAQTDPATTTGTATTNRVSGTDSLMLLGADDTGLSVAEADNKGVTSANFKLNEKTSDLQTGDVIIVCDPDHAAITQITTYTDSNVTLVHNSGGGDKTLPGNCSKGLGYPAVCTTNGTHYQFGANSQIAKLSAVDWYIGYNGVGTGGTSLYRVNVDPSAATPQFAQEMVRNVTAMSILYHQSSGTSFVPPTGTPGTPATPTTPAVPAIPGVTDWSTVDAVQVTLTLESTDQRAGTDVKPISRRFTATTTVRNRVN